jgi:Retrotransposon gag protein
MNDLNPVEDHRSLRQSLQAKNQMIADLLQQLEPARGLSVSASSLTPPVVQPAPVVPADLDTSSRMKTKNPDVWSGTRSALPRFLASCRVKFMLEEYNFTSELKKIGFAGSYLGGAPAEWWCTLFQKYEESQAKGIDPPSKFTSFAAFAQSLTMSYGDLNLRGTMQHDLYVLRQTSSVADYAAEFQRIADYLAPGWGDKPLVFLFRLHLKENVKDALVHEKPYPKTLCEMVAAAIRLDNREREKIRDRKIAAPPPSKSCSDQASPCHPPVAPSSQSTLVESSTNGYAQD